MLIHIVSFKYKAEIDEPRRIEHQRLLRTLADIDGVIDLNAGPDVVRSQRSYDAGLVVTFRDRSALDRYATNPRHVPIAQVGAGLCDSIVSVDFEI